MTQTHRTATTSKATQIFQRVSCVTSDLGFEFRKGDDLTKSNPLVIDDDEAGDSVFTFYQDWNSHTYDGHSPK